MFSFLEIKGIISKVFAKKKMQKEIVKHAKEKQMSAFHALLSKQKLENDAGEEIERQQQLENMISHLKGVS